MKNGDYIKANRKGQREAALDNGFKAVHKVHKSNKTFSRKNKHKGKNYE